MSNHRLIRIKYEPITVKEPYHADVKTFNSPDEFTVYYREHETELKSLSTLRLNKTFKIPGYRISVVGRGTDKEEIILKKDYYGGTASDRSTASIEHQPSDGMEQRLALLEQRMDNIERYLQQLE